MKRVTADLHVNNVQAVRVAERIRAAITNDLDDNERRALEELALSVQGARSVAAVVSFAGNGDDLPSDSCEVLVTTVFAKLRHSGITAPVVRFEGAFLFGEQS